jgi:hypothetical protein
MYQSTPMNNEINRSHAYVLLPVKNFHFTSLSHISFFYISIKMSTFLRQTSFSYKLARVSTYIIWKEQNW